jgi:hypothetical protein
MANNKSGLPEINIGEGLIVLKAKEACDAHSQVGVLETLIKTCKEVISSEAEGLRKSEENSGNYIGLVRITGTDLPPVRVEFRTGSNSALDLDQESTLDELFGPARPLIFARSKVITGVVDPMTLVQQLKDSGKNPWDYLTVSVKPGMDEIVASVSSDAVTVQEVFLPREGWIAKLNELAVVLTNQAKRYISEYMEKVLKPSVVLGSKGKK